jgi:putative PIN family toxin of toxin-antitoxin system
MRVVIDANVVASGVLWHGEGFLVLVRMARRQIMAFGTEATLAETRETCLRLIQLKAPRHNAAGRLTWYLDQVRLVTPAPLGKQRSRDARDDIYLAAALGARARCVVTHDKDLLNLEKPFGVETISPAPLLQRLKG